MNRKSRSNYKFKDWSKRENCYRRCKSKNLFKSQV